MNLEPSPEEGAAAIPLWRKVMPFGIAGLLLFWVFRSTDLGQIRNALAKTNLPAFFLFTAVFMLALLAADSFATVAVYRRTLCPIRYRELLIIRGASYLPSMLNHNVGQAWLTYFLSRAYNAPLWRVAGATLLVYGTNLAGLCLLAAIAVPLDPSKAGGLLPFLGAIAVAGLGYFALLRAKPKFLKDRQALAPLFEVGVKGHLVAILYRLPHTLVLFLGTWLMFLFFDVWVPPREALVVMPLIMMVSALPITPGGVGTRDVIALQLLLPFATADGWSPEQGKAAIAAATLSWFVAINLVGFLISPPLMRKASRMLAQAGPGGAAAVGDEASEVPDKETPE